MSRRCTDRNSGKSWLKKLISDLYPLVYVKRSSPNVAKLNIGCKMVQINRKIVLVVFTFKVNPYRQNNIDYVWFHGIAEFDCHCFLIAQMSCSLCTWQLSMSRACS